MDGHACSSVQQTHHTVGPPLPPSPSALLFSLPLFQKQVIERERERAVDDAPADRRSGAARSPASDVHPKVSALPLSQLTVVPYNRDPSQNLRVVASNQWCGGVTFSESDWVGSGDGWPKVSPEVPHLLLGFVTWGFPSISI
jgi:hypothetical protein